MVEQCIQLARASVFVYTTIDAEKGATHEKLIMAGLLKRLLECIVDSFWGQHFCTGFSRFSITFDGPRFTCLVQDIGNFQEWVAVNTVAPV